MDLTKILRLKKAPPAKSGWEQLPYSVFLKHLADALRADLLKLSQSKGSDDWIRSCRVMKVYCGNLKERADPIEDGYNYLFLNVPSQRGFMLEVDQTETKLELRRGTLIVPLRRNTFDELDSATLFVTSPLILQTFVVLSPDTVRSASEGQAARTLSVSRMAEWLLSLALGIAEIPTADSHVKQTNGDSDTPPN